MSPAALPRNRKPDFIRREAHYRARVKKRWRYPDGIHSPLRQYHKSRPALPTPGYGRAAALKGKHPSGRKPVLIRRVDDFQHLRPDEGALIAGTVGRKRRMELIAYAKEKSIIVLNVRDLTAGLEALQQEVREQKEARKQREQNIRSRKEVKKKEEEKKSAGKKEKPEKPEGKKSSLPAEAGSAGEADEQGESSRTAKEQEREAMEKTLTKRQ